jgi:capsular polysaccharide biosynthesis protein
VLFQPARSDYGLTETLRILLRSFVVYMYSNDRAAAAIDRLHLDMTPGELLSVTTISSDPTQLIVQIDVDMEDGPLAAQIATEMGRLLVDYRTEANRGLLTQDRIDAVMIDTASYGLFKPKTKINTLAGGILGLLLGGAVVFVLEYLQSNIVRSEEDVEHFLNLPVLAAIPADDVHA